MRLRRRTPPPSGRDLVGRAVRPVSERFGQDRGRPVDRFYIERFLAEHAPDVRGRVLELYEDTYTRRYGGDRVTANDVLHVDHTNPDATLVGDLRTGAGIPQASYDCFVCTQTLQFVYELHEAVAGTLAALAPGGVLLATLPGISQVSIEDRRATGDFWRFTADSARRLFAEHYGEGNVAVRWHGNPLAASAFLYGLAAEELAHDEPGYELVLCVRAVRV